MPSPWDSRLRAVGLRVTRPRRAVLQAVLDNPHSDTSTVLAAVRRADPSVSHQAVYDGLGALHEAGLVRRLQPAGSVALYELENGDNHHHLVCRSCRTVLDVECATGKAPCLHSPTDHGFAIDEAEVTYWGLCPECRPTPAPSIGQER